MTPMAIIMKEKGFNVTGSDIISNNNTKLLNSLGVKTFVGHSEKNINNLGNDVIVIYSSAIDKSNPELQFANSAKYQCCLRGDFLAKIANTYKRPVAVSGSHGKTTVTAMLAHILQECNMEAGYMIGGKVSGSNKSATAGNGDIFITEADESDGTHALLDSYIGIVNNVEDDHAWNVGGPEQLFKNFANFAKQSKYLFYVNSEKCNELFKNHPNKTIISANIANDDFKYVSKEKLFEWGEYQRINANVAIKVSEKLGVSRKNAEFAMNSFSGVARRMSLHYNQNNKVIIEDYAHHPTEVNVAISALRERYPNYKLKIVFQPHRYARLKLYLDDFAKELQKADEVIITPVFAAWVEKGDVNSKTLADLIGENAVAIEDSWEVIGKKVKADFKENEVVAILGAGDIDSIFQYL